VRRALVTGGSGALGAAICRRLGALGFHVVVHANTGLDRAERVAREIREAGGSAGAARFDVADRAASEAALEKLLEDGPIQVLVNNAGVNDDAVMPGMRPEQWEHVIGVSLNGFFNVTRPLLLPMMRTRWGRIVSMSSVSAILGNRGQANYAAAKAGLHGASKSLALEIASRGVTVNVVAPGIIESSMTRESVPAGLVESLVPLKRTGTPDEVAALVAFLCSDAAGYITGQTISINGGMA